MTYLERLRTLEPNPLVPLPLFRVAYYVPKLCEWHTHRDCSPWSAWFLCKACAELGRPVRVQEKSTGRVFGTEVALLNLFSNRLSDRSQEE